MKSVEAINIVRNKLRTNLQDPYALAGGNTRSGNMWIFADEPLVNSRFPVVQLLKVDNPTSVIDIGPNYMESEYLILNLWFKTKNGFKIWINNIEYNNAQLVEYYQGLMKETLKSKFLELHDEGVIYRHLNTGTIGYDPDTQLYFGSVTIRLWYFNR